MVYSSFVFNLLPSDLLDIELMTILDKLADKFTNKHKDFINYFVSIKGNQEFVSAIWKIESFGKLEKYKLPTIKYDINGQVYDILLSVQQFNKRYVKFEV